MAKQDSAVTTRTLAQGPPGVAPPPEFPAEPPRPLDAPVPGHRPVKTGFTGPLTEYRVMVRHSPLTWYKSLVVQAPDEEGAWVAFQAEVADRLTAAHLTPDQSKSGRRVLAAFRLWISQQPPGRIPAEVTIRPETEYQQHRKEIRDAMARGTASTK